MNEQGRMAAGKALDQASVSILLLNEVTRHQFKVLRRATLKDGDWQMVAEDLEKGEVKRNALMMVRKGLTITSPRTKKDMVAASIAGVGTVVCFYNHVLKYRSSDPDFWQRLCDLVKAADSPTEEHFFLAGDANCQHSTWAAAHLTEAWKRELGEQFVQLAQRTRLELAIEKDTATYIGRSKGGERHSSTIDVAFARGRLRPWRKEIVPHLLSDATNAGKRHHPWLYQCHAASNAFAVEGADSGASTSANVLPAIPATIAEPAEPVEEASGPIAKDLYLVANDEHPWLPHASITTDKMKVEIDKELEMLDQSLLLVEDDDELGSEKTSIALTEAIRMAATTCLTKAGIKLPSASSNFVPKQWWSKELTTERQRMRLAKSAMKRAARQQSEERSARYLGRAERKAYQREQEQLKRAAAEAAKSYKRTIKEAKNGLLESKAQDLFESGTRTVWSLISSLGGQRKDKESEKINRLRVGTKDMHLRKDLERTLFQHLLKGFQLKVKASKTVEELEAINRQQQKGRKGKQRADELAELQSHLCEPTLTRSEVSKALFDDPDKSPGIDNITAGLLQKCWKASERFQRWLVVLYQRMFNTGKAPSSFRKARVIVIHKDGKPRDEAGDYRPISLLSCMTKIYERALTTRWQFTAANGGMSSRHFGAVPGVSAEDGIATLRQAIVEGRRTNKCSALTGVDVQGAFNNAQHHYLIQCMKTALERAKHACGLQPRLLAASRDLLRDRTAILDFNGQRSPEWTSSASSIGIPQGSPLSPISWLLYVDPLLRQLERLFPVGVVVVSYVDDINVLVTTDSWKQTARLVRQVNSVIRQWAQESQVGLDKGYMIPLLSEEKYPAEMKGVDTPADAEGAIVTREMGKAKILGIVFHRSSTANHTIADRTSKVITSIEQLHSIDKAATYIKVMVANALLFPRLEYGLWPLLPMTKTAISELREADMRIVSWIFGIHYRPAKERWISYEKLCGFLGILPVEERLWVAARKRGQRKLGHLCTMQTTSTPEVTGLLASRLGPLDVMNEAITVTGGKKVIPPWKMHHAFDSIHIEASKEAAKEYHDRILPSLKGIVIYTDGSKQKDGKNGAGYAIMHDGVMLEPLVEVNTLPEHSGVYDSELTAIAAALRFVHSNVRFRSASGLPTITIFTDSQSSAAALRKMLKYWTTEGPLSEANMAAMDIRHLLQPRATLDLAWIPGHWKVAGNDMADTAANEAAKAMTNALGKGESWVVEEAERQAWARAVAKYNKMDSRTVTQVAASYHRKRGQEFRSSKVALTNYQSITRLMWLGGYAFTKARTPNTCSQCGDAVNTTSKSYEGHLLFDCSLLAPLRRKYDIIKSPNDKSDDWLMQRPELDQFLFHLNTIRQEHKEKATAQLDSRPDHAYIPLPDSSESLPPPETEEEAIVIDAIHDIHMDEPNEEEEEYDADYPYSDVDDL